jgi:hypothetical protein
MNESKVPGILDWDLVKHLIEFASSGGTAHCSVG